METNQDNQEKVKKANELWVSSGSDIKKLSKAIFAAYLNDKTGADIVMTVVGAGALNQATKGIILANSDFTRLGLSASILPVFVKVPPKQGKLSGGDISAIQLRLKITKL